MDSNSPSESEMMADLAAADSAGDTALAQHIAGKLKSLQQPQPGIGRRVLSAVAGPFDAMKPLLAQQQENAGPSIVGKDSPDVLAGAGAFVSGLPGAGAANPEAQARQERFTSEHPIMGRVLPLAASFGAPVPAARAAPKAPPAAPAALESALPGAVAAGNPFEAAARATKVQELAKTIEANATAHLGVDTKTAEFADTIAKMPEQWWEGMAQVAKVNKPSPETVGQVADFFRSRATQTATATESLLPAATAAQPGPIASFLGRAGEKLSTMPRKELDLLDLLAAGHYGIPKAAALKLLRNYGPPVAGAILKKASQVPAAVAELEAANAMRGALERQ